MQSTLQRKIIHAHTPVDFRRKLKSAKANGWYQVGQYSALMELDIATRTYKALKQQQQEFAQMQVNLQELMNEIRNVLEGIEDDRKIEGQS